MADSLRRLLQAQTIAFIGGDAAAEALRQCQLLQTQAQLWPVHPTRPAMQGVLCFTAVDQLPAPPDVAFVAVNAQQTVSTIQQLSALGCGAAVCYASGFAEVGPSGAELQQALLDAAGSMPLLGPNCYGYINYALGHALWPDQHGGQRLDQTRGVAIITQSGNIGLNLTMQQRGLPLAYIFTLGNMAAVGFADLIEVLLDDATISAIGLHIEGLDDVVAFARVARRAAQQGVALVALKTGHSSKGAALALSHTSSLAGGKAAWQAAMQRYGVVTVTSPAALLETLKLLHVCGPLHGRRIASASCSGGEASLVADLAQQHGLSTPDFDRATQQTLSQVLGPNVHVANPLDYHTYIWGDLAAQTACFSAYLSANDHTDSIDAFILVLDFPQGLHCDASHWRVTLQAYCAAVDQARARLASAAKRAPAYLLVSTLAENLPRAMALLLLQHRIAPMLDLDLALQALSHAADYGERQAHVAHHVHTPCLRASSHSQPLQDTNLWDEATSKAALRRAGLHVPENLISHCAQWQDLDATQAQQLLQQHGLHYPLVVKALGANLAHKSEQAAVALRLENAQQVLAAVRSMQRHGGSVLIESMIRDALCELLLGFTYDAQCGWFMTLGVGGVWVELQQDQTHLLLPASAQDIEQALQRLRISPVLRGYRGAPAADVPRLAHHIARVADWVCQHADTLSELEINPYLVLPKSHPRAPGVAVDALLRSAQPLQEKG